MFQLSHFLAGGSDTSGFMQWYRGTTYGAWEKMRLIKAVECEVDVPFQ